ncbi:MAG: hypothetical protein N2Z75_09310, partial [Meiothermus sp.]|nr:hypothetical protein [Meiothermus sp.]
MHEFIERLHRALECYRALRERIDELEGQLTENRIARDSLQELLEQADIAFTGDLPRVRARVVS